MAMAAPMRMNTGIRPMPIDLLTLQHWLSPAFPLGAFAYSHGLESAISRGWVNSGDSLRDWLAALLEDGSGRADAPGGDLALARARVAGVEVGVVDRRAVQHVVAPARVVDLLRQAAEMPTKEATQ